METQLYDNAENRSKFSTYLALGSFALGTIILLLHLLFPDQGNLLFLGLLHVALASLLNGLVFLNLFYRFCIYPNDREILAIKMLIMLVNIPIAFLYFYIVIHQNYSY